MPGIADVEIPKHYAPTFERNILHAPQQRMSKLEAHVSVGMAQGEGVSPVDLYGNTEAEEATDRYADTPIAEIERARRWCFPRKWHWGTMVNDMDQLKQILDPTSAMIESARMALGRILDRQIIMPAFFGAAIQGKDITDALAGSPVAFNTTLYRIANTIGSSGGATPVGMNVAKLQAAKKLFMQLEVDIDTERPKVGITAQQWSDLFDDVKTINGDYVNGRPLQAGDLPMLLGFDFVQVEQLPSAGTTPNDRYCPVWVKSGIALRKWQNIETMIGRDPGKQYQIRPYIKMAAGAVRSQEGRVLQIVCREP
jgi:hypothetical protein